MPLFLDEEDKNFKRFTIGMAMLNYNIAYLCHTQGVEIPLSQVTNTLQSLMACCRAHELGIKSHALIYQGIKDLEFSMDFQQVVRMTLLRYRCRTPLQQDLHSNRLHDNYYKITKDLSQSEDDDGLYLDSEEEEDGEYMDQTDSQSENWNLVDVIPSFGTRANNGYEGENIFQLGAANIMPRVTNMVESLSGRSLPRSQQQQHEQQQQLQSHEYFFTRLHIFQPEILDEIREIKVKKSESCIKLKCYWIGWQFLHCGTIMSIKDIIPWMLISAESELLCDCALP
ncbi:hypothetical protein K501DRAFT_277979 [Backusella circina FSU 941]|nr:hypothetical protein K501DRAFT_277979 [Backusella circina FSU 941]